MTLSVTRASTLECLLPERDKQAWLQEARLLRYPDPAESASWHAFVEASVNQARAHLPSAISQALADFFSPGGSDILLLRNLPVDPDLPAAPEMGKRPSSKTAVSESVIAGILERYVHLLAYSNEKSGAPVHEVAPVRGRQHTASIAGRAPFLYHTDIAFLRPEFAPRGMMLFGLKNETRVATTILPLERVLESAPAQLVASLEKPIFRHPAPASFDFGGATMVSEVRPVLWWDKLGIARIAVQTHAVQPVDSEARYALAYFRALLPSMEPERIMLSPGSALLFKNDRVLHGRDEIVGERWLQRAYFTNSLEPLRRKTGIADGFVFDARVLLL